MTRALAVAAIAALVAGRAVAAQIGVATSRRDSVRIAALVLRERHSRAADVRLAQEVLARLGFFRASATGRMSAALRDAIRRYQASRALRPSGVIDDETRRELKWAR
jgi:peptidoglycan hydrolase-like protein with peptidoglycan-binding domain